MVLELLTQVDICLIKQPESLIITKEQVKTKLATNEIDLSFIQINIFPETLRNAIMQGRKKTEYYGFEEIEDLDQRLYFLIMDAHIFIIDGEIYPLFTEKQKFIEYNEKCIKYK